jgi:predicted RNA-binding protein with EMAP domain
MSKFGVTKEQIESMIQLTKRQLASFDHIMNQNDSYDELRKIFKETDNKETRKALKSEIDYFKNTILPLRRKERAQIVKAISLLTQMSKDVNDINKMNKLSKRYYTHLLSMDEFKTWLHENNHQVWS